VKARPFLIAALMSGAASIASAGAVEAQTCEGAAGGGARLNVIVNGVRAAEGQIAVTVYPDNARRFLAPGGKLLRVRTRAVAPTTRACFNLPGAGTYAVVIYHDADGDSDFDRSAIGRPTEGFGFSNDAPARLGLPSFRSVRFAVTPGDNTIRIQTRYP